MSTEICYNNNEFNSDLDIISQVLMKHYEKNIQTTLNSDDEELLNSISDALNKISNSQNIKFNEEGFKTFIKKIFVYNFTQFGGDGDEIVPYSKKKISPPNRYDFFVIVMVFASIFLLYISFIKFNELSQSVTGMDISEIGQDIKSQMQDALSKIKELPLEQLTFVQYIYNSIQTFSCSIVESQSDRIKNIVTESLSNMVYDFVSVAEKTCMPRTEIITEGTYQLSSSITGSVDFGKTFNTLIQSASALSTSSSTSSCVANTALVLQRRVIDEMFHQRTLILNQLTAQTTQAINFFYYGVSLGTPSVLYLVYRTKDVLGVAYTQIRPQRRQLTETGGRKRRTKKHRKTLKRIKNSHRKKSKKHRYNSRKFKL